MSSSAHHRSGIVWDDIHFEHRAYVPWDAYGQSKTANVLFAVEATRRWAGDGITVNALMPGGIRTNLQRHVSDEVLERMRAAAGGTGVRWKTPQQGAATSVLLAVSPLLDGISGRYFDDCNEAERGVSSSLFFFLRDVSWEGVASTLFCKAEEGLEVRLDEPMENAVGRIVALIDLTWSGGADHAATP